MLLYYFRAKKEEEELKETRFAEANNQCWERVAGIQMSYHELLMSHQWQSALLVVGLPVIHDLFEMRYHFSPSLILIRLMA